MKMYNLLNAKTERILRKNVFEEDVQTFVKYYERLGYTVIIQFVGRSIFNV